MDTQAYIESGILEQYALGELSGAERAEVERQLAAHPALRQELDTIEQALAAYAAEYAQTPPAGLRERVLAGWQAALATPPAPTTAAPAPEPVVRSLSPTPAPAETGGFSWLLAASVALLLLSAAANLLLYTKWRSAEQDLAVAQSEQARVATMLQATDRRLSERSQEVAVLRSDQFENVTLAGTPNAPDAKARVLYNPETRAVYVDVQRLPELPPDKQYQLWALYNGKPIDAGLLTAATAAGDSLQLMKAIARAQAFAMTVEPAAGSATPTLSTMAVMGKL